MGYIVYHAYNGVCNFYKNGKTTNVQDKAQVFKRIGEALKVALELTCTTKQKSCGRCHQHY